MSVDMDRIDNDELYEPRTWAISPTLADRWINLWGSPPPFNFTDPGLSFVTQPLVAKGACSTQAWISARRSREQAWAGALSRG